MDELQSNKTALVYWNLRMLTPDVCACLVSDSCRLASSLRSSSTNARPNALLVYRLCEDANHV
jgi:hypothetical protein